MERTTAPAALDGAQALRWPHAAAEEGPPALGRPAPTMSLGHGGGSEPSEGPQAGLAVPGRFPERVNKAHWGRLAALLLRVLYSLFPQVDRHFVFVDDFLCSAARGRWGVLHGRPTELEEDTSSGGQHVAGPPKPHGGQEAHPGDGGLAGHGGRTGYARKEGHREGFGPHPMNNAPSRSRCFSHCGQHTSVFSGSTLLEHQPPKCRSLVGGACVTAARVLDEWRVEEEPQHEGQHPRCGCTVAASNAEKGLFWCPARKR